MELTKQTIRVKLNFTESRLLPPANKVWGKVMFLHLSVSHSVHGGHQSGLYASYWNAYLFLNANLFLTVTLLYFLVEGKK